MQEQFASFLKARMAEKAISQAALAETLGVSATAIWNWRRGTQPGLALISALAAALDVNAVELAQMAGYPATASTPTDDDPVTRLTELAGALPPPALQQLILFAEFLGMRDWRAERQRFALENLARAYGDDEPEYTLADIQR